MSKLLVSITLLLSLFGFFSVYADGDVLGELNIYENAPVCKCGQEHSSEQIKYLATNPAYYEDELITVTGDVDNDGRTNSEDALIVLKVSAGIFVLIDILLVCIQ